MSVNNENSDFRFYKKCKETESQHFWAECGALKALPKPFILPLCLLDEVINNQSHIFYLCVLFQIFTNTLPSKLTSFTLSGYLVCPNNSVTFSIWYLPSTNLSCMSCSYSSLLVSKSSVDLWLLHSSDLLLFFSSLTSTTKPFLCLQSFLNPGQHLFEPISKKLSLQLRVQIAFS